MPLGAPVERTVRSSPGHGIVLCCARAASHPSADARGLGMNGAMPAIIAPGT
jgi:hypothetical protein